MTNPPSPNEALREALKKQCDNMAFVLNRCTLPDQWYCKLSNELQDARATLASPSPASSPVAREVMTLVIAARAAWEEMQDLAVSRLNLDNLDRALEAFSSRVPYENEPKGATASSPVGEGDNALLNTARRNIRTFINGASFKCSADKEAALACVDVLESNLSQPTPASARDNQAIWDALRDFTLADGRTLESFFVKGNDKINFCCLIASLSPLSGEPASVAGEAETLIAAGFDDYAAHCALKTESDGGFCHAYFYSDGQWRFQTGGHDLTIGKDTVRCVLTKRLYAHPPLSKPTPVEAKPWYETDAHRDLSRIIPDMEGKIADAKTRYAHCLPDHLFAPLEASITELRVLRHEVAAQPTPVEAGALRAIAAAVGGIREGTIRLNDGLDEIVRTLSETPPPPSQDSVAFLATTEATDDVNTHRANWRRALEIARDQAEVSPPDIDDRSYWEHEIRVFDRTFDALLPVSEKSS